MLPVTVAKTPLFPEGTALLAVGGKLSFPESTTPLFAVGGKPCFADIEFDTGGENNTFFGHAGERTCRNKTTGHGWGKRGGRNEQKRRDISHSYRIGIRERRVVCNDELFLPRGKLDSIGYDHVYPLVIQPNRVPLL